jgi:hypothetical protein
VPEKTNLGQKYLHGLPDFPFRMRIEEISFFWFPGPWYKNISPAQRGAALGDQVTFPNGHFLLAA